MTSEELKVEIAKLGQKIEGLKNKGLENNAEYLALVENFHLLTKELFDYNGPDVSGVHNYVDSNLK